MAVVLLGPPGVGKGTQAVRLADHLGAAHVSTGDLLRAARREGTELGREAQRYMDAGELVPDRLILDLVREHLQTVPSASQVIFDGFPRTTPQAEGLDGVLEGVGRSVDLVVSFAAPDEELVRRLSGRRSCASCGAVFHLEFNPPARDGVCDRCGGALTQRADDQAETVRRRLQVYHEQTAPLVAYYERGGAPFRHIPAERPVDEVFAEFLAAVEGAGS